MTSETQKYRALKTLANISFWWGAIFTPVIIFGLFANPDLGPGLGALIIFGLGPLLGGYFSKKNLKKKYETQYEKATMRSLMLLAQNKQGKVTASEVSLHLNVDYEDAKKALETVVTKGIAVPEADDDGTVIYYFRELD